MQNTTRAEVPSLITYTGPHVAAPSVRTSVSLPAAPPGTNRVTVMIDGVAYFPLVADCPAAGCTNTAPIANAIPDEGTRAYQEAVARKQERDINIVTAITGVGGAAIRAIGVVDDVATAGSGIASAAAKGGTVIEPTVTAKGIVNGAVFEDVNQTAKVGATNQPTLIADRVAAKAEAQGKPFPNGTVADSHAEIGVIQQAYNAGKTKGAEMSMTVSGKDVCGYCRGDIAAAADAAELKSLTIQAVDSATGLPKTYYWQPGMKSIKERP